MDLAFGHADNHKPLLAIILAIIQTLDIVKSQRR